MASQEGIDVDFDEKSGFLQIKCQAAAFPHYRQVAGQLLQDAGIPLEKVSEIHILDLTASASQLGPQPRRVRLLMFFSIVIIILGLAVSGAISLIGKLLH